MALGDLELASVRRREARGAYEQALSVHRERGNRPGQAHALLRLGRYFAAEDVAAARSHFEQAIAVYEECGLEKWRDAARAEAGKLRD